MWANLRRYVADHLREAPEALQAILLCRQAFRSNGRQRLTWLIFRQGEPSPCAVARHYADRCWNWLVESEYRVCESLWASFDPPLLPRPLALATLDGYMVFLEEGLAGASLSVDLSRRLSLNPDRKFVGSLVEGHLDLVRGILQRWNQQAEDEDLVVMEAELSKLHSRVRGYCSSSADRELVDAAVGHVYPLLRALPRRRRVIHRDVVPTNIIILPDGPQVVDWEYHEVSGSWVLEPLKFVYWYLVELGRHGLLEGDPGTIFQRYLDREIEGLPALLDTFLETLGLPVGDPVARRGLWLLYVLAEWDLVASVAATKEPFVRQYIDLLSSILGTTGMERARAVHQIIELDNRLQALQAEPAEREGAYKALQQTVDRLQVELAERERAFEEYRQDKEGYIAALRERERQLEEILKSDAWALVQFVWWLRPKVAPSGTLRERALRLAFKPFRVLVRRGFRGFLSAVWARVRGLLFQALHPPYPFRDGYVVEDNTQVILYADEPALFPRYEPRRQLRDVKRLRKIKVCLIAPVKNESRSIYWWWEGISKQSRLPDEIVVVDTGSTDRTVQILKELAVKSPVPFRVIEEPSANIAQARNIAIRQAQGDVIACIDFGCQAEAAWLEKLVAPFENDPEIKVSCGWHRAVGLKGSHLRYRSLWPEPHKIHPATFIPSGTSVAFRKESWQSVGGYPEWLTLTGEDTYFGLELKRLGGKWAFVPEAVVQWEAPESIWGSLKKMFIWSTGDGESGVRGNYYWRYALGLVGLSALVILTGLAVVIGLVLGGLNLLWPFLTLLIWILAYRASKAALGARPSPLMLAFRAAAVLGFLAGSWRRRLVQQRRWNLLRGVWFILSGIPIDDTGGGARATQLALELLRQGHFVVFISRFPKYESKELGLKFVHPNLRTYRIQEFNWQRFIADHPGLLENRKSIAIVEFPEVEFMPIIDAVRACGGRVVYDLIDDWSTSLGGRWYSPEIEKTIIGKSDVLTATAPVLVERLRNLSGQEVHLLPNAVNSHLFDPDRWYSHPADLPNAAWRMVYVGALWGEWFDWDLLMRLADAYPESAVVVIGDYRGQCPGTRTNLHFLGLKLQRNLPAYLAYSDVAIIPWKVDKITQATSPLKVYEYLAMRKPVVAPDIPSLRGIPGIYLAKDPEECIHLVAKVRQLEFPVELVKEFINDNTWEARVRSLLEYRVGFPGANSQELREGK